MGSIGQVNIGGITYVERYQTFPLWLQNVASLSVLTNVRLSLPGQYMFRLKALARDVLVASSGVYSRASRPFLFRLGGSNDSSWYTGGAVPINTSGTQTDRVLDTNLFGTGQFPAPLAPTILYPAGSQISCELQDVSNNGPYDIHFGFIGAYLIPTDASNNILGANG